MKKEPYRDHMKVLNGSDYETYTLTCDLSEVTETVRKIFEEAAK